MKTDLLHSFLVDFMYMLKITSIVVNLETDHNITSNMLQHSMKYLMKRNLKVAIQRNEQDFSIFGDNYPKLYMILSDECSYPLKMVQT